MSDTDGPIGLDYSSTRQSSPVWLSWIGLVTSILVCPVFLSRFHWDYWFRQMRLGSNDRLIAYILIFSGLPLGSLALNVLAAIRTASAQGNKRQAILLFIWGTALNILWFC